MQLSDILTSLINELQLISSGFCSPRLKKYWSGRGITNLTLDHFDVRAYNPRKRSLTTILEAKEFTAEDIKPILYGKSGEHELFGHGSLIPARYNRSIWNLIYIPLVGLKMYCSSIQLKHPFNIDEALQSDGPVIVCEAPIDCMSAWQLGVRAVISTFGTQFDPLDFSPFMGRQLTTLFDNDPAGKMASEKFQRKYPGSKSCFIPEEYGKDVNDFLKAGGTPEQLAKIISSAKAFETAPHEASRLPIVLSTTTTKTALEPSRNLASPQLRKDNNPVDPAAPAAEPVPINYAFLDDCQDLFLRIDEDGDEKKLNPSMYDIVCRFYDYFTAKGAMFTFDKNRKLATLYLEDRPIRFDLGDHEARNFLLDQVQVITPASFKGREFFGTVGDYVSTPARATIVESAYSASYDRKNHAAYFYAGPNSVLRVSPNKVEQLKNGLNSFGVGLLAPTFPYAPWRYEPRVNLADAVQLVLTLYVDGLALDKTDALVSFAFNCAHMFPSFPIRPIRENNGPQGSGKSDEAKLWGTIIYGLPTLGCFTTESEAWIALDRNMYVVLDNLEDNEAGKYFILLTSGVTGGSSQKRKLYSDETLLTYSMNGQVTITCIRGSQVPEVLQRTVPFVFDTMFHKTGYDYQTTLDQIVKNRPTILSALFNIMAHEILPYRDDPNNIASKFLSSFDHPKKRLNPFFKDMLLWLSVFAKARGEDWRDIATQFFNRSSEQYSTDVADSDLVIQSLTNLKHFLKEEGYITRRLQSTVTVDQNGVLTLEGYAPAFFHDFCITNRGRTEHLFRTPKSLGQRLRAIDNKIINSIGWSIDKDYSNRAAGIKYKFTYNLKRDFGIGIQAGTPRVIEKLREEAAKSGLEAPKELILDRPVKSPSEALSLVSSGKIASIEIPSIDFLGSSPADAVDILQIFERHGIPVVFMNERRDTFEQPFAQL